MTSIEMKILHEENQIRKLSNDYEVNKNLIRKHERILRKLKSSS